MCDFFEPDRLNNLNSLKELGYEPYLCLPTRSNMVLSGEDMCAISCRVLTIRRMGKIAFMTVQYSNQGNEILKIQLVFKSDISNEGWEDFVSLVNTGDIIYVEGDFGHTASGEPSIFVKFFDILTKALTSVNFGTEKDGEEFNKIKNVETLVRHRNVALLTDTSLRRNLLLRSKIINDIRMAMSNGDYIEANTPILLSIPGGAEAKTFDTHYNEYDMGVKLRISLEIQLKKILCGGIDRVYEMGTVFRNEGVSPSHNPEFTLLEYYRAGQNFSGGIQEFKNLMSMFFKTMISWETITMREAVKKWANVDIEDYLNDESFMSELDTLMKNHVEPNLSPFTILTHHPIAISPLAKSYDGKYAKRFEAYINGIEVANGFEEQNDPIVQYEVLKKQSENLSTPLDEEFIYALSCGMPPTFGVGVGVDRIVKIITEASHIRDITWFPFVK